MKLKLLTLALAATFSITAQASITQWGVHDQLEVAASITPVGHFEDSYLFTLAADANLFTSAATNNLTQVLGIQGLLISLYRETGAVDTAIGSFGLAAFSNAGANAFGTLASGDYYYTVSGVGTGSLGGFYSLGSTVTPIPEPQTLALLLGGLGALGFMSRRRTT
jgi:hypothetical protein